VRGADWRNTRTARGAAPGVHTAAGTWALNEAEAAHIAASVDADEAWDRAMDGKADWTNRPVQPPGLGRCVQETVFSSFVRNSCMSCVCCMCPASCCQLFRPVVALCVLLYKPELRGGLVAV
jgi:hypothetical protein